MVITASYSQTSWENTSGPWAEGPGLKGSEHMSKNPCSLVVLAAKAQPVLKKSLAYPACPRVTIWAALCSPKQALYPIHHSTVVPPWQQRDSLNKRFKVLAAKVSEKITLLTG